MIIFYNVVDFSLVRSRELGPAVSSAILGNSVGSIVFLIFSFIFSETFFSVITFVKSSRLILESLSALDNKASIVFNLFFANAIVLLCLFFLFLVTVRNDLLIPVPTVNIKAKEESVIPADISTTIACEAILNVPNDADKVINILSK